MSDLTHTLTPQKVRGLAVILASLAVLGVFVLPWLVPTGRAAIVSDSQAAGFSNRTAMVALAIVCVAMAGLGLVGRRSSAIKGTGPLLEAAPVARDQRVSRRLVVGAAVATVVMVGVVAAILRENPSGEAEYFMDALLRVIAGGRPYSQIEFSYGPLLLYPSLALYAVIGKVGLGPHVAYYSWVALFDVGGLLLLAYILNRVRMPAVLRSELFVAFMVLGLLQFALPLSYTLLRFLLPYALFLWCLDYRARYPARWDAYLVPIGAVLVAMAVSPEMGVALLAALLAAAVIEAVKRGSPRGSYAALGVLVALTASLAVLAALYRGSTFGAFAGGAYYFPVLPGLSALAFVATMLIAFFAVGSLTVSTSSPSWSRHVGWLALATVLIVPAFGRADSAHIVWNGMGAVVLGAAAVEDRWRRGGTYLRAVGFAFIGATAIYAGITVRPIIQSARMSAEPSHAADLASFPALGYPDGLSGKWGRQIAESGHLVPSYTNPARAITQSQFEKARDQLRAASTLAVPIAGYESYAAAAEAAAPSRAISGGVVFSVPARVGDRAKYGVLLGVPVSFPGRNEVFDPEASFGMVLKEEWRVTRRLGDYVLLEKRGGVGD